MEKFEFIEYIAKRYGIDESMAETMIDMFADSLQELICAGTNVNIDEIGEFRSIPLFPHGINHQNKLALAKLTRRSVVSFKPSEYLTKVVA